jgi:uncharacterized protein with ParB-like and HNH nuclease domain/predicted transport protein
MKASEARLLDLLKKSPQFIIPIYQRTYSWTEKECRQLWDDILRAGSNDSVLAHFVGSIVYIEKDIYQVSNQSPLLVIDGQQRLTTVTLLLSALAYELESKENSKSEPVNGFSPRKIRHYYLINQEEENERRFKLILSQTDKESLISIVGQLETPKDDSNRVRENFNLFKELISNDASSIEPICKGLSKLIIVDVALSRSQDNPQLIFESMNSTGKELSQADLIRNFILMGLEPQLQTKLYEQYWRPMEKDFGQDAYANYFDRFMRHYLTVKTGEIPNLRDVYEGFKIHSTTKEALQDGVESLVRDIRNYARYFCSVALGIEEDTELKKAFHDLRELKVDVALPFLLELYHDYQLGKLSKDDLVIIIRLIEAYVFRRVICNIPTNSMNKTFATFTKGLAKDNYLEDIKAKFLLLPSYRRFPSDEEFKRDIQTRDLYNFRSRSYWLRRLENFDRKERVPVDEYTIEHILPQNENLSDDWRKVLGTDWEREHQKWLHTLGNLTLTGYNSEYSDKPFIEKRDMKGGFKESPLRVNSGLGGLEVWNVVTIKERALKLAGQAVTIWKSPSLPPDILEKYKKDNKVNRAVYTLEDHQHLLSGAMRELFEAFQASVLKLDPCVTEDILKLYIAYKAETNFVDVVPQAKRLRLAINIPFSEIVDPRGICRDVTNLGRWGNGDVEVALSSFDELPYILGLVRQAFERQMGES